MSNNYHWASPRYIDEMYCDDLDFHGIVFWYNEIEKQQAELKANTKQ